MFLRIVRSGEKVSRSKKNSAKNARHKVNLKERKKQEQEAMTRKKEQELEKIKEDKKHDFIKFITSKTLYEDDDWYHEEPREYKMLSAYEIAINLGPSFDWVIMDYDNFIMPDPTILNENRSSYFDKSYGYYILELPNMDYILNVALRRGCNTIIIERLLQKGASPNKTPFDYRSINQKLIARHIQEEQKEVELKLKRAEKEEWHREWLAMICRDNCQQTCTKKCLQIANEYDDYDDYDDDYSDDYNPTDTDLFLDAHSEYQLIPPICIAAVSGMWSVVTLLLKYKANIQEHVLEYEYQRISPEMRGLSQFIVTKYTALDYAMRSFNKICINLIKTEYQKIQSDKRSLMQCLSGKRNANCIHIPGIYKHIKSFLGQSDIQPKTYSESRLYINWNKFPIYSKLGLHIYCEKQDSFDILRFTRIPIFEALKNKSYKDIHQNWVRFYNTEYEYSRDVITLLPHTSVHKDYTYIGSIKFDDFDKPDIYMKCDLDFIGFVNASDFNEQQSTYTDYSTYVNVQITNKHIIISCTFDGGIESMFDYYLTKYKQVINTDIFGIYIRNCGFR